MPGPSTLVTFGAEVYGREHRQGPHGTNGQRNCHRLVSPLEYRLLPDSRVQFPAVPLTFDGRIKHSPTWEGW